MLLQTGALSENAYLKHKYVDTDKYGLDYIGIRGLCTHSGQEVGNGTLYFFP